ncbi:MAG: retropepsin-like aspartic protease [Candidatus Cloacimonetes bacterium]|jgi:hypothetical protein|nr:retropepsin-like aspartic protease [Candidatus Cloacimonadota bacterium]
MNFRLDFKNDTFNFNSKHLENGIQFSIHKNKIFFNPTINGLEVKNLIFDTGASNLSIEKELSNKLNLKVIEPDHGLQICDSNGNLIEFENYEINTFQLGNITKHNFNSYGYSFNNSRKLKNFNQNGIIGKTVFDGHTFGFDIYSKLCLVE